MSVTPPVVRWSEDSLADFTGEVSQILEDFAPSEVAAFKLFGEHLVREMSVKSTELSNPTRKPTFEFGEAVEFGLLTLHLLAGTLALVEIIQRAKGLASEKELEAKVKKDWVEFLVEAGMDRKLAIDIPAKYSLELAVFLAKHKIFSTGI